MNTQPKNKILVLIICILLVANIGMLILYLKEQPATGKRERPDRQKYVAAYLKNEVGFTDSQLQQYEQLGTRHKEGMKALFDSLFAERKTIFRQLAASDFNDSSVTEAANGITSQQHMFELKMLRHLKDIRMICTAEQRTRFDTGFYKILGRRQPDSLKNKK